MYIFFLLVNFNHYFATLLLRSLFGFSIFCPFVFSNSVTKINFHRCVLDECQEIKTATTNIAKMCQQVQATHRWMVSGTPLSSKIDDLHGELNFLQVCL